MNLFTSLFARTGQIDVYSNQGECRLTLLSVRAAERARHKPHIRIGERVYIFLARFGVALCYVPTDIRKANKTIEISDGGRLGVNRITSRGGTGTEDMVEATDP